MFNIKFWPFGFNKLQFIHRDLYTAWYYEKPDYFSTSREKIDWVPCWYWSSENFSTETKQSHTQMPFFVIRFPFKKGTVDNYCTFSERCNWTLWKDFGRISNQKSIIGQLTSWKLHGAWIKLMKWFRTSLKFQSTISSFEIHEIYLHLFVFEYLKRIISKVESASIWRQSSFITRYL